MKVRVGILGHFGEGENLLNGQTVKTKIVTEELEKQLGKSQVLRIDTHGGFRVLLKSPLQVFRALKNSDNVVIFPAHNGLRVYAPLLTFFNIFFKRDLHYAVIGGWLPEFVAKRGLLSRSLKKFDGIYVETSTMKAALEAQGFKNIYVMPNCKRLEVLSEDDLIYPQGAPYRLCTFSRVMREKGIEDAVNAVIDANNSLGSQVFSLDIYGQIDGAQTEWFEELKNSFPSYIRYGGLVPFDKSVEVLKDYFALLFPTYYSGEGFAGTLIDAYSAGVPVIASDWKYNAELVSEDVGYVYPTGDTASLTDILIASAEDPSRLLGKKRLCLREAEKYKIDNAVRVLIDRLGRS